MEKSVVVKASNVELAVEKALAELEATRDRVRVEVLQKGGLFQRAEVRVTLKETAETLAEDFVNGVLAAMNIKACGKAEERDGEIVVDIEGEDGGSAIGYPYTQPQGHRGCCNRSFPGRNTQGFIQRENRE